MRALNVLVCGKVRDIDSLRKDVFTYRDWLRAGSVARVVFSGWLGDAAQHPALFDELEAAGFELVFSAEPELVIRGNIFHQMKNLHYGLSRFDDDELVLKLRTDKVHLNFDPLVLRSAFAASPKPVDGSPFQNRVVVQAALPFNPFFFSDLVYLGVARDLQKYVSFDLWFELEHGTGNAEQVLNAAPFLPSLPHLRQYFRVKPGLVYHDADLSIRLHRMLLEDPFHLQVLGESLVSLRDSFLFWHDLIDPSGAPRVTGSPLTGLLAPDAVAGRPGLDYHPVANTLSISTRAALEMLCEAPISAMERGNAVAFAATGERPSGRSARMRFDAPAAALAEKIGQAFPDLYDKPPGPQRSGARVAYPPRISLIERLDRP